VPDHVATVPGLKPGGDARISAVDGRVHIRPPDIGTWTGSPEQAAIFAAILFEVAAMASQPTRPEVVQRG